MSNKIAFYMRRGSIHMKFSMKGQGKRDLLIYLTA
jgi:hypothetical protein